MTRATPINHYNTLNLPCPPSTPPTSSEIKQAYRLALLTHHPDKTGTPQDVQPVRNTTLEIKPSVDSIKQAYSILSDPTTRQNYDRILLLHSQPLLSSKDTPIATQQQRSFLPGSEVLDLDDLSLDDGNGLWYHPCRCGEKRGYVIREGDLEREESRGGREVVVGCVGCSLWVRVGFGVVEDEEGEQEGQKGG